jgi:predicted transcriptional regulator
MINTSDGRRNQLKIIIDILDFVDVPQRPTHIMNQMNLNHSQLKKYLLWLTDTGLLDRIEKPFPSFQISKKGSEFVKMLQDSTDSSRFLQTNEINYEGDLK